MFRWVCKKEQQCILIEYSTRAEAVSNQGQGVAVKAPDLMRMDTGTYQYLPFHIASPFP
jgi:hypothetical protein